jgi:hypothetical protein
MSRRDVALRLGFTCWLVYTLHFATNMVRENYLALAIGDHFSFRVDEYANMHDDIFEQPGHGWHIGANPGASMIGAIPYALSRPVVDRIVAKVQHARQTTGASVVPHYDAPTEKDRRLYEEAWRRGFDVKFGLASFVMQSMAMAVLSAIGVVVMFLLLAGQGASIGMPLSYALLYAFGTPVFFRSGFLNHNLMIAHVGLIGFALLWDRWNWQDASAERRFLLAGLAGGISVLLDYSGLIILLGLLVYGLTRHHCSPGVAGRLRRTACYAAGAAGPILLLWLYQWRSFGHPFLPPQHWMPAVEWSDAGYQGVAWPQLELAKALAFDYRYGLFVSCPLFLLALAAPLFKSESLGLPRRELITCVSLALAFFVFFSMVQYTRWQFNTGVRYLAPVFPFLFLPAAAVLRKLPRWCTASVAIGSVTLAWSMAMARDVSGGKVDLADPDAGRGVLDPLISVLTGGLQLPALTTLSRMEAFADHVGKTVSALPLLILAGAILYVVWKPSGQQASGQTSKSADSAEHSRGQGFDPPRLHCDDQDRAEPTRE